MATTLEAQRGLYLLREWREGQMPIILAIAERRLGASVSLDLEDIWFGDDDVDLVGNYTLRLNTRLGLDDPVVLQNLITQGQLVRIGDMPS